MLPRKHMSWSKQTILHYRYINKFGDTHSRSLCQLATRLLTYTMQHQIQLTAEYIPGRLNMSADTLSRQLNPHQYEWQVCPNIFNGILHQTQTYPNIDLFASPPKQADKQILQLASGHRVLGSERLCIEMAGPGILYMFPPRF